jgi:mono/diheme cytochrome c family protein
VNASPSPLSPLSPFPGLRKPLLLAIISLLALALTGCSFSLAADITPPPGSEQMAPLPTQAEADLGPLYPLAPPNPKNGALIYADKCQACHGPAGLGDGPMAAQLPGPATALGAAEVARQATPAQWYKQVSQGNLQMRMPPFAPPMGSLADQDRWDVVAYALSLSAPAEIVTRGSNIYQEECARCHGEDGRGGGPDADGLTNAPRDFSDQSFMAEKTAAGFFAAITQGVAPDMPAFGDLPEDDRWALTAYLRSLTFASTAAPQTASATPAPYPYPYPYPYPAPAAAAPSPAPAAPAGVGQITGSVIMPEGEALPADMTVTLHAIDVASMSEFDLAFTQTVPVQADGLFVFENVEMPPERVFQVALEYQGITFSSDIAQATEGQTALDLPVEIPASTNDVSVLTADRLHLFFEFLDTQTVQVLELYIFSNPGDKTLIAAQSGEAVVEFTLPEGASGLEIEESELTMGRILTPQGFALTQPIPPGTNYQILFAYLMPYDRKLDLNVEATMPVGAVVILAPEGEVKIKSDMLQDGGVRAVEDAQYHTYTAGSLPAGGALSMTITGKPAANSPGLAASSQTSLVIGLVALGITLIAAGVWLYRRSRRDDEDDEPQAEAPAALDSAETVMDAIIALDDLYREGGLPEEAYRQRRAELKERLSEYM